MLIVEDSMLISKIIKDCIQQESDMEVVGIATNGLLAVEMTRELKPDLITMDIIMPELDGIEATKRIMSTTPTPIIIISSHLDGEIYNTFKALEAGALTAIPKPKDINNANFQRKQQYIVKTIRAMSEIKLSKRREKQNPSIKKTEISKENYNKKYDIIALGCSTGGPGALKTIFSALPEDFNLPIVVVQHIGLGFGGALATWLDQFTKLKVKIADDNERLQPGVIYVSPDSVHLTIRQSRINKSYNINLLDTPEVGGFKPSINVLFDSLASYTQGNVIAGLLTGMGQDGAEGLLNLRHKKCRTFVQDAASSVIFGMPKAALDKNAADDVLSLDEIANYLVTFVKR